MDMFLVVIQLGAIFAVILLYWKKIFPFKYDNGIKIEKDTFIMWIKIIVACLPAAIVGLLFDDKLNELFFNPTTVAIMLILFGILFIVIENYNKGKDLFQKEIRRRKLSINDVTSKIDNIIKEINNFDSEKNIKLTTYTARCIENEILMFLKTNKKRDAFASP